MPAEFHVLQEKGRKVMAKSCTPRLCSIAVAWVLVGIGQGCASAAPRAADPELARGQQPMIHAGETVTDSLTSTGPMLGGRGPFRAYRLAARAGEAYDISLTSADFDAYLQVVTYIDGVPDILRDDDGGEGSNALLRFQPRETGTYLIIAQALTPDSGAFTLAIGATADIQLPRAAESVAQPNETPAADTEATMPRPLAFGVPIDAVLRGGPALYTFPGSSGESYVIELSSGVFDSFLEVGTVVATRGGTSFMRMVSDDDGGAGLDSRLIFTPTADSQYVVSVSARGDRNQGRYTLKVGRLPPPVTRPIQLGTVVRGDIDSTDSPTGEQGRPADDWLLAAVAGRRYAGMLSATGVGAKLDTYLAVGRMRNRRFVQLGSNDDGPGLSNRTDSRVVFTATESGDYVLRAMPWDADSTGAYELRVDELPRLRPAPERRRIAFGQEVQGALDSADFELPDGSRVDEWVISANRADTLVVTLTSTDFDAFLSIGASVDGRFVAYSSNDDAAPRSTDARVVMLPPSTGEYVIRANSISPIAVGRYLLKVGKK